jgi:hypothetical protein
MTHVVDPTFAFLGQWSSPQRENRIIELKVMREESEEVDQSAHQYYAVLYGKDVQLSNSLKIDGTPFPS